MQSLRVYDDADVGGQNKEEYAFALSIISICSVIKFLNSIPQSATDASFFFNFRTVFGYTASTNVVLGFDIVENI